MTLTIIVGASLREPHTCGENGKLSIYMCIYMFVWYVRIPYMHSALFVRDAIFPHLIHVERSSYMSKILLHVKRSSYMSKDLATCRKI